MDNYTITTKFHVVNDSFNIPSDGILGKDFIKGVKCNISYENMTISFYLGNKLVTIDILSGPINNTVVLPPRSESIRKFNLKEGTGHQLINSQEIRPGVFVARTIVDRQDTYVNVLYTNETPIVLPNNKLTHESVKRYSVYSANDV